MDQQTTYSFQIYSLEDITQNSFDDLQHRHIQSHFEIIWMQDGGGYHKVDGLFCGLRPGYAYCAVPGQQHELMLEAGSKGYLLAFQDNFLQQEIDEYDAMYGVSLKRQMRLYCETRIDESTCEDMTDMLLLMLKETSRNSLHRKDVLVKYLKIFILFFRRQLEAASSLPVQGQKRTVPNTFFSLLETDFKKEKSVSYYAQKLSITPNHLNQVIKATTGYSAKRQIQQRLLHEAKRAALYKHANVKEIAYELGFADSSHFSKFFKNIAGTTYSMFRDRAGLQSL